MSHIKNDGNLSNNISQGDANASSRQGSYLSDDLLSSSVPDPHPDNKKGKLACARHPNNQQSNDSVVDIELSKCQSSGYYKGDMVMEYEDFLEANRERYNRLAVYSIVVSDLFPRIKFWINTRTWSIHWKRVLSVIMS